MKTLRDLLLTSVLSVGASLGYGSKVDAYYPFYQHYEFRLKGVMEEVKGTKWKEVSEITSVGKADDSTGDYFIINRDLNFEFVDGKYKRYGHIEKYTIYDSNKNKLRFEDGKGSFYFEFNNDRSKMQMTIGGKIINYERIYPPVQKPGVKPVQESKNSKENLIEKIKGTGWKEDFELFPGGNSEGDYIIFERDLNFELVDGKYKKVGKIARYDYPKNNKDMLQINDGEEWYTLVFNDDRTKMSLTIPGKIIKYKRYFPKPEEKVPKPEKN